MPPLNERKTFVRGGGLPTAAANQLRRPMSLREKLRGLATPPPPLVGLYAWTCGNGGAPLLAEKLTDNSVSGAIARRVVESGSA